MIQDIQGQIKNIKLEVSEFHPLLHEVFSRHPSIIRVENTHGNEEKGADFVLIRRHEILKREEYIGVVAKVGKLHQNLSSVQTQIEECLILPRFLEQGKKQIYLSEVWVVASSTITPGAKAKIRATHKSSKIHFLSGDDLASLVVEHVPYYWSKIPIETSSYLERIRIKARDQDQQLDIIQLTDEPIYIEQEVDRITVDPYNKSGKARSRHRSSVNPVIELESNRFMLIEAGMGGGKSKLIRHLLQSIATDAISANKPWLPISTTYKILVDDYNGSLADLFEAMVPPVVKRQLADDARIIFCVDGIDEKDQSQSDMFSCLQRLAKETRSNHRYRLILTSRFIGNLEFEKQFHNAISRYEIRRLTVGKLVEYLKRICKQFNLTNRIVDDIRRSPLFARLPKNPLAAVLLAQVLRDNRQDLPATLPELYSKYIELALGRWDISKGLQSQQEYEVLETVLMELANYLLKNNLDYIDAPDLQQRIGAYLDERSLKVEPDVIFEKAVERSELLAWDGHVVRFRHRSFAEFLEAKRRIRRGTVSPSLRAFETYWANIYYFAVGEMKDAPEFIEGLSALVPEKESHRWLKAMNMANYVMAAYATPYQVIEEAVYHSMLEAAKLLHDIVNGQEKSCFGKLSRMDLLCLMQVVIRDHYGFEFLGSALEGAAIRVMDEEDRAVGPYCLFLLAVASVDAGRQDAFETWLEEHRGELPLDVSLGIVHEGNARSTIIKRFARRLRRKRKNNDRLNRDIALLYDGPIGRVVEALPE